MIRVGITGGIGSGKSTVSRVFEALGVPVYYTDTRAKELMVADPVIVAELTALLGEGTYKDGALDRQYVASRIFTDRELIRQVNAIVHPRVAADFMRWAERFAGRAGGSATADAADTGAALCDVPYVVMECAIMFESGFEGLMDYVLTVSADLGERVERASSRDGIDPEHIRARMANQMDDAERERRSDFTVLNSDNDMAVGRILELHEFFTDEGRKSNA